MDTKGNYQSQQTHYNMPPAYILDSDQTFQHPAPPPPYDNNANVIHQGPIMVHHQHPMRATAIVTTTLLGPNPANITCPSCRKQVVTRLDYETSTKTHILAGLLCLFICWPCFWLPYVIDSCKNANHYCPSCNTFLGSYKT